MTSSTPPPQTSLPVFRCPVDGCDYWVVLGGYTEHAIRHMKIHVSQRHDLPFNLSRMDGGLVDSVVAKGISNE